MSEQHHPQQAQQLLNQIVYDFMKQQRHQRIWRWLKRGAYALILGFIFYSLFISKIEETKLSTSPHVGLIDIQGEISDTSSANSDGFSKALDNAYKNNMMKALIIRINSPGGSPVQADYMFNSLQYFKHKHPDIKVYAVCVDSCTSAAYYVASSADEIYANPASIIGSIGVIYDGFGFNDILQKVGVSRRLITAGKNKGFMDPFSPESDSQKAMLQNMLDIIHQQFINKVKLGRGNRLIINDETFSGLAWTGEQAKSMGLIDGFASTGELMRNTIKLEDAIDYTEKLSVMEQVSKNVGASFHLIFQDLLKFNLN
jgi:protease-4